MEDLLSGQVPGERGPAQGDDRDTGPMKPAYSPKKELKVSAAIVAGFVLLLLAVIIATYVIW